MKFNKQVNNRLAWYRKQSKVTIPFTFDLSRLRADRIKALKELRDARWRRNHYRFRLDTEYYEWNKKWLEKELNEAICNLDHINERIRVIKCADKIRAMELGSI